MRSIPRLALPLTTLALLLVADVGSTEQAKQQPKEQAKTGFIRNKVYKDTNGVESKYFIFVPHDYKGDKDYPIILFLHGKGDTGAKAGLAKAIQKKEKTFPLIAVFPSSEKGWTVKGDGKTAVAILDEVIKEYKVDKKRVYLTGLSMGGFGTWTLAVAHPERWAAIVPICGGGDAKSAAKIKDIPCWCFHGDSDMTVNVSNSRNMIKAVEAAGGKPKYTEYKGVDHNSWDRAYATTEMWDWMLKQTLKK